jgi:RNA polymerase sigma factor (sigma-70 family)
MDDDSRIWLERLQGPEPERSQAIAQLRETLLRGLSRSINHRYGGVLEAEDVVQDALLKVLASLAGFEGRCRFVTWAMTIAVRVGISALRRRATREISLDALAPSELLVIADASALSDWCGDTSERENLMHQLNELMEAALTDRQRYVLRGLLEGIPVDELARRMDTNRNALYKLAHDARMKLKLEFERLGITGDATAMTSE